MSTQMHLEKQKKEMKQQDMFQQEKEEKMGKWLDREIQKMAADGAEYPENEGDARETDGTDQGDAREADGA